MTDEQFEHAHRLMWLELAKTGDSSKLSTKISQAITELYTHYPVATSIKMEEDFNCFACGEAVERSKIEKWDCRFCPIEWPKILYGRCQTRCLQSIYGDWCLYSNNMEKRKKLAMRIAQLPWKRRKK
jgi:hypothetical protein